MRGWRCACGTVYRLRISRCPRCHGTEITETEVGIVPKIRRIGGVTIAAQGHTLIADATAPVEVEETPVEEEQEVAPSAGSSSSASPPKPPTNNEPTQPDPPKPARTTANRSAPARKGSSTARSTGGNGTASD